MDVSIKKGTYVIAASGGVDSMVLLHILRQKPGVEPIVAHFNHGIRPDAAKDEEFVRRRVKELKIEIGLGNLGPKTSEDKARQARYVFLEDVRKKYKADAIITAHHQDDLIETALLNLLRGSGRRGLTSMSHNSKILRPLLNTPKTAILKYAKDNQIEWVEDPTNQEVNYLRNYIRQVILPNLDQSNREELLSNLDKVAKINRIADNLIETMSQKLLDKGKIKRNNFITLPPEVGHELLMYWLRNLGLRSYDRKIIARLTTALKTAPPGTIHEVYGGWKLVIGTSDAHFAKRVDSSLV